VTLWTSTAWLAEAHTWIRARVAESGARVTGPIEQPHVRLWSTALRAPTSSGDLWFKANHPLWAHEAAVVRVLASTRADLVPPLVAVDDERGWMLMADGGERLREVVQRERDLGRWLDVLAGYGTLQIDVAARADELVALGVPERRLDGLAGRYARLLDETDGLSADERSRLTRSIPRVAEMCSELAALGIPETIQHDDLHDGQVFVRDEGYLFFDWGDACVAHPFFSMAVALEGGLAWGLDDVERSVDIGPFRDAYLRPFARFAAPAALEAAHATGLRLGWICRALTIRTFADAFEGSDRERWLEGVRLRLRMFLGGTRG
jgi:phosphotransferase family enzyme